MLVKSIIAGTVLSLMAGGVVYFGTDIDTAAVKEKVAEKTAEVKADISDTVMAGSQDEHPHDEKTETIDTQTSIDTPSVKTASGKIIEAKKPTISYSSDSDRETVKTAEIAPAEKPQKKWLDQYLKTDSPKKDTEPKIVETETEEVIEEAPSEEKADVAKDLMESMGLTKEGGSDSDTASYIVEEEVETLTEKQIEIAEAEGFEERALGTDNIWVEDSSSETGEKKVEVKVIANEDGETRIETETIDMGDGKIMKIVKKTVKSESHDGDDKKMRIKVMTDKDGIDADNIKVIHMGDDISIDELMEQAKSKDISGTVDIVMEQAEKIKMPELRDRAYLDLVSYGLEHGHYDVASDALSKIEQVELRDTARNRIAVAYAKDGNANDAFGILENIEVDALRDVMRLQVIEAMIAPEELPEDMQ